MFRTLTAYRQLGVVFQRKTAENQSFEKTNKQPELKKYMEVVKVGLKWVF